MWFTNAVLSSDPGSSFELVNQLAKNGTFFKATDSAKLAFVKNIAIIIGSRKSLPEVSKLLAFLSSPALTADAKWLQTGLSGLGTGLKKSKNKAAAPALLNTVKKLEGTATEENKKSYQDIAEALKAS
ncbi:hypothetical protein D3C86_1561880 [compost metagenome]